MNTAEQKNFLAKANEVERRYQLASRVGAVSNPDKNL